jgi:hypothetical protein
MYVEKYGSPTHPSRASFWSIEGEITSVAWSKLAELEGNFKDISETAFEGARKTRRTLISLSVSSPSSSIERGLTRL